MCEPTIKEKITFFIEGKRKDLFRYLSRKLLYKTNIMTVRDKITRNFVYSRIDDFDRFVHYYEIYFLNYPTGLYHNLDGPAQIGVTEDVIKIVTYHLFGTVMSAEARKVASKKAKLNLIGIK